MNLTGFAGTCLWRMALLESVRSHAGWQSGFAPRDGEGGAVIRVRLHLRQGCFAGLDGRRATRGQILEDSWRIILRPKKNASSPPSDRVLRVVRISECDLPPHKSERFFLKRANLEVPLTATDRSLCALWRRIQTPLSSSQPNPATPPVAV